MLTSKYHSQLLHPSTYSLRSGVAGLLWCCLCTFPLFAQDARDAQVLSIWHGEEPVDVALPGSLCWQRGSDLYESDVLEVGDVLNPGDVLSRGPCPAIWRDTPLAGEEGLDPERLQIGLRCGDGTEIIVSGPSFLVMVLDPAETSKAWGSDPQGCAVDLAQGTLDVIAEQPMEVHSGGVTIGVEGTQFVVERLLTQTWSGHFNSSTRGFPGASEIRGEEAVICRLLEGRVRLFVPDQVERGDRLLEAGHQWLRLDGLTDEAPLPVVFVDEAAERLARADVARGWSAGTLSTDFEAGQRSGCVPCDAVELALPAYAEALRPGAGQPLRGALVDQLDDLGLIDAAQRERRRSRSTQTGETPEASHHPAASPCSPPDASGVGECPELAQQVQDPASQRVVLPLKEGVVILDLPQPLQSGQPAGGYMTVSGVGEGSRAKSGIRKLSKLHVTVGDIELPVQAGPWSLQLADVPADGGLTVALRNRKGKALVERVVEVQEGAALDIPTQFAVSSFCHADEALTLTGPFDGDPSNTQVLWGGEELVRQAERPGQLVVACPETAQGSGSLNIVEGTLRHGVEGFRSIEEELDVARRNLRRGQRTRATVTLRGLKGRNRPVGLRVLNKVPGVIRMEGGDARFLTLWPEAWGDGDTFSIEFELLALRDGQTQLLVEPVMLP